MTSQVFVTGMLRSGTTLLQTLLTNHPQLFVAYQPFHQLYVDVKQLFLDEQGWQRLLPLGDGMEDPRELSRFFEWLDARVFDRDEVTRLVSRATGGKGGGAADFRPEEPAEPQTFLSLHRTLHRQLAEMFGKGDAACGAKEVLCEEYVPFLAAAGIGSLLIVRDPRSVIASANHGRYRDMVGDRYPLLMLVRLWRRSARSWLALRADPSVRTLRYEDLVQDTDAVLSGIAGWLGLPDFEPELRHSTLLTHRGDPWVGNSSFGDKATVDAAPSSAWVGRLSEEEIAFIEACTCGEMRALGYALTGSPRRDAIRDFVEDTRKVRAAYLAHYGLDAGNRARELAVWDARGTD